jgi:VWFA-related protein
MTPGQAQLELHTLAGPTARKLPPCIELLLLAFALAVTASPIASAQNTVETTPSPTTGQPQFTIRARVPLTIVDVVVTDQKGHPVHGLKQSDFTLLEDNQPMHPNSFEEHRSDDAPTAPPTPLNLPPDTFTNAAPTPGDRPLNVLILDSLDTPIMTQTIVQQRMVEFVNKMTPGTRLAVLSLSAEGRLSTLQGFTSDHELLKTAIGSKKITGQVPRIEDSYQDDPVGPDYIDQDNECNRAAMRGQYTLNAMNQVARYLSGMPGRKNLIWSAGSFPLAMKDGAKSPGTCYDYTDNLKAADDNLARAHVVLYPIDPRALDLLAKFGPMHPAVVQQADEHLTLEAMAEQTGGKALYNNNDLGGLAIDAIHSGANFYTLTYTPTNQSYDTRFRTIKVTVDQPNLHLTYRNGYYAVGPDVTLTGKAVAKVTPMQAAMMRGSLEPTQILFKVRVTQSPTTDAKLSTDNQPDAKQMKPPFRHYTIAYAIDVHGIDFAPGPDGNYRGGFEYGVRVYNADGDEIVNSVSKTVNPVLPPAVYKSMLTGGANAHLDIDLPATGNYFLRIAVHDLTTDHVGAIEIPTSSITPNPTPTTTPGK